ncbi:PQQ-binding-like beta-propeller repeat protein [Cellulomonas sp. S1-8]|uniref:outer membrane protein assembly factor BamB family protein n=1 Tax=Cellulomonas sp. S1-8 TaxID=2904790 RepID=UPI0022446082|nr:PQQ-binding-like beta-propeller repeat protein [Cellulomonas sp. S1-8]UZN03431.1 PQQ-binding-like beta-propeller repeat protein [Cellulomonas sp. S1-8]
MARRGPLHDVELVDDDEHDDLPPGPDPAPSTSDPGDGRRRTRPLVVGAVVLTLVVVGAVVGQSVVDGRERARLAAVAALPGTVDLLSGAPTARWEATDEDLFYGSGLRAADGSLVGVEHASDGPVRVVALDAATGDTLWEVELLDGTTRPEPDPAAEVSAWSGRCTAYPGQEHLALCWVHDGMSATVDDLFVDLPASAARLVLLDTADGSVVADLADALGDPASGTSFTVAGDLVVVGTHGDDGVTEVRAVTSEGTLAWQRDVPAVDSQGAYVSTVGDLVALATETELRLFDAAGRTVRTVPLHGRRASGGSGEEVYLLPYPDGYERGAGGSAVERSTTTTVVRPEGDVDVEGDVLFSTVDDGSVPGLVLTTVGGRLTGWGVDGGRLWSADAVPEEGVLVLDGRVHVDTGTEVLTLDARTGAELWRSDATNQHPVTDGRHLLALAAVASRGEQSEIVALDPADGSEMWRGPLPDGTDQVSAYQRLLVAVDLVDGGAGGLRYTVLG